LADITSDPYALSTTASSNSPSGATVIGAGLDDNLRAIQAAVKSAISGLTGVAGTNTITATAGNVAAYAAGQFFVFVPANTNTGATTLNINSLGPKSIFQAGGALTGNEIVQNVPCMVAYDGTQFNLIGPLVGGALSGALTLSGQFTASQVNATGVGNFKENTATPAGGVTAVLMGSSSMAICLGSGVPTLSALKGSLYLRTDGSTTTSRAYINTDGGTTWTALTTVA